jgi:hypothetical protein
MLTIHSSAQVPWTATKLYVVHDCNQLLELVNQHILPLIAWVKRLNATCPDQRLLRELLYAGLNCRAFNERQKYILCANSEDTTAISKFPIWANGSIEYPRQIVQNWRELAPGTSSFMRLSRTFAVIQALVWQTLIDEHSVSQPVLRLLCARRICAPLYNFEVRMMKTCLSRGQANRRLFRWTRATRLSNQCSSCSLSSPRAQCNEGSNDNVIFGLLMDMWLAMGF